MLPEPREKLTEMLRPPKWKPEDHLPVPLAKSGGKTEQSWPMRVHLLRHTAGGEGWREDMEKQVIVTSREEMSMPKRGLNGSSQRMSSLRKERRFIVN